MQLPVILVVGTLLSTAVALPVPAAAPGDGYDGAPPLSKSVVSPPLRSMKQMLGERMKKARFEASNRGSACLEKLYNELQIHENASPKQGWTAEKTASLWGFLSCVQDVEGDTGVAVAIPQDVEDALNHAVQVEYAGCVRDHLRDPEEFPMTPDECAKKAGYGRGRFQPNRGGFLSVVEPLSPQRVKDTYLSATGNFLPSKQAVMEGGKTMVQQASKNWDSFRQDLPGKMAAGLNRAMKMPTAAPRPAGAMPLVI